jgi:hypothetical protein
MSPSTRTLARAAALTRLTWGAVLLVGTGPLLARFGHRPADGPVTVGRVLGGRQVAQGLVTALAPGPAVLTAGAAADTLHAATAVGLAVTAPRWRTVALTEVVIASTLAATGFWLEFRARRRP